MKIIFGLLIMLTLLSLSYAHAGELYSCIDRNGNTIVTDSPQDGMTNCTLKDLYDDSTPLQKKIYEIRRDHNNRLDEIKHEREQQQEESKKWSENYDKKWAKERCESARKNESYYRNLWRNAKSQDMTDYYKRRLDDIEETCAKAR